ncbi:hypothetical protein LCGC14_1641850 [marine sediment metagenome]|uniref:Uncharacterized protein n=1 Tax=marine sediment metagenome TaxID=412755 RepID=A0A0F9I028_9ZZZZ
MTKCTEALRLLEYLEPEEREMWERLEGGKTRGCGTLWYGQDMEGVLRSLATSRGEVAAREAALLAQGERLREALMKYGNHHSSCILEHHAPGIRDCGCGFVAILREVAGLP